MPDLTSEIAEYLTSDQYRFLDDIVKPHAESLLHAWVLNSGSDVTGASIDAGLKYVARLDLPLDVRMAAPDLIADFFGYLGQTGREPRAAEWACLVSGVAAAYRKRFNADGKAKGETVINRASETGRNAPCPCGSGLKFKKCCMKLML
jgi:hypothetical protein